MREGVIIIGIAGSTASGKSLLANTLVSELGSDQVVLIGEDSYYKDASHLTLEDRMKINFDHPDAFDHELLIDHLKKLQEGESINVPQYDFTSCLRSTEATLIKGNHYRIIIVEGILIFTEPRLRDLMEIKIFMDTPLDTCLIRRIRRDVKERGRTLESVILQYQETVRPMYFEFVEPAKRHASIIVPNGGPGANVVAIDMILAKMREFLGLEARKENPRDSVMGRLGKELGGAGNIEIGRLGSSPTKGGLTIFQSISSKSDRNTSPDKREKHEAVGPTTLDL